jgi:hypothetical protein
MGSSGTRTPNKFQPNYHHNLTSSSTLKSHDNYNIQIAQQPITPVRNNHSYCTTTRVLAQSPSARKRQLSPWLPTSPLSSRQPPLELLLSDRISSLPRMTGIPKTIPISAACYEHIIQRKGVPFLAGSPQIQKPLRQQSSPPYTHNPASALVMEACKPHQAAAML